MREKVFFVERHVFGISIENLLVDFMTRRDICTVYTLHTIQEHLPSIFVFSLSNCLNVIQCYCLYPVCFIMINDDNIHPFIHYDGRLIKRVRCVMESMESQISIVSLDD